MNNIKIREVMIEERGFNLLNQKIRLYFSAVVSLNYAYDPKCNFSNKVKSRRLEELIMSANILLAVSENVNWGGLRVDEVFIMNNKHYKIRKITFDDRIPKDRIARNDCLVFNRCLDMLTSK